MAKKTRKTEKMSAMFPAEAVVEFCRVTGMGLLDNEDIPNDMHRSEYAKLADAILEKRLEKLVEGLAKHGVMVKS
jgi:hypothetical protein